LRKLGVVLHISSHGYVILKATLFPKIDTTVLTKRMEKIGTVHDVFGPVQSPYISVRPLKNFDLTSLKELRGEKVYI
jgi:RNA-binding protein